MKPSLKLMDALDVIGICRDSKLKRRSEFKPRRLPTMVDLKH